MFYSANYYRTKRERNILKILGIQADESGWRIGDNGVVPYSIRDNIKKDIVHAT